MNISAQINFNFFDKDINFILQVKNNMQQSNLQVHVTDKKGSIGMSNNSPTEAKMNSFYIDEDRNNQMLEPMGDVTNTEMHQEMANG